MAKKIEQGQSIGKRSFKKLKGLKQHPKSFVYNFERFNITKGALKAKKKFWANVKPKIAPRD